MRELRCYGPEPGVTLPHPQFICNTTSHSSSSRTPQGSFVIDFQKAGAPGKVGHLAFSSLCDLSYLEDVVLGCGPQERETEPIIPGPLLPADERDLEDFLLDFEEDLKALHSAQCSPAPGEKGPSSAAPTADSEAITDILATLQSRVCAAFEALISLPVGSFEIEMSIP